MTEMQETGASSTTEPADTADAEVAEETEPPEHPTITALREAASASLDADEAVDKAHRLFMAASDNLAAARVAWNNATLEQATKQAAYQAAVDARDAAWAGEAYT